MNTAPHNGYPGASGSGSPGHGAGSSAPGAGPSGHGASSGHGAPAGYGAPSGYASPAGAAAAPPQQKSRKGLFIGIGCCVLAGLLVAVLAVVGGLLFLGGGDDPEPTPTTVTEPADPTDEPTVDPTDDPTVDPTDEPTDEPTDDPTQGTASITVKYVDTGEATELETSNGTITPENDVFVGTQVQITNENDVEIGLGSSNFRLYDQDGNELSIRYGEFTTAGPQIPPGETADARLWVDVESGTTISKITYSDSVGTNGHEAEIPIL